MNAEDVKPNRLEKAKFEINQIIRRLKGDRVGIIVFAGVSHLYLPLTSDYEAANLFLEEIDTEMIPTQGTDISSALNTGLSTFSDESEIFKVLVLITDGEDLEGKAIGIAKNAAKEFKRITETNKHLNIFNVLYDPESYIFAITELFKINSRGAVANNS